MSTKRNGKPKPPARLNAATESGAFAGRATRRFTARRGNGSPAASTNAAAELEQKTNILRWAGVPEFNRFPSVIQVGTKERFVC